MPCCYFPQFSGCCIMGSLVARIDYHVKLLLILLTLVSPTIARAQTSIVVDVVMLKNGTKLTGTILSDVKKKPLKIRTTDGETHTVKRAMIKSISKETLAVEAPPPPADTSSKVGAAKVDAAPPMASTVSKQSDSYAPIQKFRFGPVSSMPLGDFSTASDPGAGVMAEYSYEIANNFSLDGRLGYLYWFGKNLSTENVASYIDVSSVVLGAGGRYAITSNFSVYGLL